MLLVPGNRVPAQTAPAAAPRQFGPLIPPPGRDRNLATGDAVDHERADRVDLHASGKPGKGLARI